jgi:hypothetical protein
VIEYRRSGFVFGESGRMGDDAGVHERILDYNDEPLSSPGSRGLSLDRIVWDGKVAGERKDRRR